MAKSILFIIDPIQGLKKDKDTSLLLMKTSMKIGHQVFFCSHNDISTDDIKWSMEQYQRNRQPFDWKIKFEYSDI